MKAFFPLLLLLVFPLRSHVIIGDTITWFPQTDFYFHLVFIIAISLTVYNLAKAAPPSLLRTLRKKVTPHKAVLALMVIFALTAAYFSLIRLYDLTVEKPDSHIMITALWNSVRGDIMRITYLDGPQHWFSLHFQPILFLFIPLYMLPGSIFLQPALLQLLQVGIGVSGALPVYLFARRKLQSDRLGVITAATYLLLPVLQFQVLFDFHLEIISLVAILWSIYFLEGKNYRYFLLALTLAIISREEFALYASLFGIYMLFKKQHSKKLAGVLLMFGITYWMFVKFFIIPYFAAGKKVAAQAGMYAHLGGSPAEMVRTLFFKPGKILSFMFSQRKIQYLVLMGAQTGFLAFLSPVALLSIPFFAMNLILNFDLPSSIFWHYQSWLIPIMIWSTIEVIARNKAKLALSVFAFTAALLSSLYFGPVNIHGFDLGTTHKSLGDLKKSPRLREIEYAKTLIPKDARLAADTGLAPFFADRRNFYLFPDTRNAEYIVLSLKMVSHHSQLHASLVNDGYCLRAEGSILLYKRQQPCMQPWTDNVKETTETLAIDLPISPAMLDRPLIKTVAIPVPAKEDMQSIRLIDYEVLALSPSKINLYTSSDGKRFHQVTTCSALADSYCKGSFDAARFVRMHLFADSRFAKKPTDVKVERLILRTVTLEPGKIR